MHELMEMLKTGGGVMVVTKLIILAGSIAAVIIGIERALFLRGFSAKARELHEQIVRALLRGEASIALHESDRSHVATVALYRAAFDRANRQERVADAVDRARREVIQALRAPLWVLATLGATMPFIGLFGTVVGILGSFRQIGITGQSGFAVVAPAISEALITTAGGIAVAVEAVILFNVFQARISKEAFDLTPLTDIFLVLLIIFMVGSSIVVEQAQGGGTGVRVDLPKGAAKELQVQARDFPVAVLKDGTVVTEGKATDLGALKERFQKLMHDAPEAQVIIQADAGVSHGRVVEVMEVAKSVGVQRLAIATEAQ